MAVRRAAPVLGLSQLGLSQLGLLVLGLALLAASFVVPAKIEIPALTAPYPRAACAELRALHVEAAERGEVRRVVVTVLSESEGPCAALYAELLGPSVTVARGRSDVLYELHPDGRREVELLCIGCDIVRPTPWGYRLGFALRYGSGPFLVFEGLVLLAWSALGWSRRPRLPRPTQAPLRASPERAPTPVTHVEVTLEASLDGGARSARGPFVWLARGALESGPVAPSGPHLKLAATSRAAFREDATAWPSLVGPGRVSGLVVPPGAEAPLASGDVVRLGDGPPMRVVFAGLSAVPLRLRLGEEGWRLGVTAHPTPALRVLLAATAVLGAAAAVAAALLALEVQLGALALALAALVALAARGFTRQMGVLRAERDGVRVHTPRRGSPRLVSGVEVERLGDGRGEVRAVLVEGRAVTIEQVRPSGASLEARALAEQWLAEAEQLGRASG